MNKVTYPAFLNLAGLFYVTILNCYQMCFTAVLMYYGPEFFTWQGLNCPHEYLCIEDCNVHGYLDAGPCAKHFVKKTGSLGVTVLQSLV